MEEMIDHHAMAVQRTHQVFRLAVVLKAVDGILELAGGILLHCLTPTWIQSVVFRLTTHELSEDPTDLLANGARHAVVSLGGDTQHFATLYLLAHGIAKLVLAAGLLREYRAAFPVALAFFGFFVVYQLYRLVNTPSLTLLVLSLIDVVVIGIVWREYAERFRRGGALP